MGRCLDIIKHAPCLDIIKQWLYCCVFVLLGLLCFFVCFFKKRCFILIGFSVHLCEFVILGTNREGNTLFFLRKNELFIGSSTQSEEEMGSILWLNPSHLSAVIILIHNPYPCNCPHLIVWNYFVICRCSYFTITI